MAGFHVDLLKHSSMSVSGTPVNLFLTWLIFCISSLRDTFLNGILLIFLVEVFPDFIIVAAPVYFVTSAENSFLPVSSIVP